LSNGIPIAAFTGQPKDEELLYMVTFLEELYATSDVRPQIENTFKLTELLKKHGKVVERKDSNQASLI
jgi:TFIIF-interacting CTD phosphatase-like protein